MVSHVRRALSDDTIPTDSGCQPFQAANDPLKNLAARVAAKLEEGDFKGAVRVASSDESFASTNSHHLGSFEGQTSTSTPAIFPHPTPRQQLC